MIPVVRCALVIALLLSTTTSSPVPSCSLGKECSQRKAYLMAKKGMWSSSLSLDGGATDQAAVFGDFNVENDKNAFNSHTMIINQVRRANCQNTDTKSCSLSTKENLESLVGSQMHLGTIIGGSVQSQLSTIKTLSESQNVGTCRRMMIKVAPNNSGKQPATLYKVCVRENAINKEGTIAASNASEDKATTETNLPVAKANDVALPTTPSTTTDAPKSVGIASLPEPVSAQAIDKTSRKSWL